MNYRHAYHAGNFADVMKHTALVAVLAHVRKKETPFAVIDTHAGRGLYDLQSMEAQKSGEAEAGVGRFQGAARSDALTAYLDIVRSFGNRQYPGSPLITARMLCPRDRFIAIEKHPEEFAALKTALAPYRGTSALDADGYEALPRLVPPRERRGLILIDPPYESEDEFERTARAFEAAYARFPTGIYMIWLPLKQHHAADALAGEIRNAGAAKLLSLTLDVGRKSDAPPHRLSAAGLLVANPPYGFATAMEPALTEMAHILAQGERPRASVQWLAGSE